MRQRIFIVLYLIVLFDLIILLLYSGFFYVTISEDNWLVWVGDFFNAYQTLFLLDYKQTILESIVNIGWIYT